MTTRLFAARPASRGADGGGEANGHALAAALARALGLSHDGEGHQRECDRIERARKALMQLGGEPVRLGAVALARRLRVHELAEIALARLEVRNLGRRLGFEAVEIDGILVEGNDLRGVGGIGLPNDVALRT